MILSAEYQTLSNHGLKLTHDNSRAL